MPVRSLLFDPSTTPARMPARAGTHRRTLVLVLTTAAALSGALPEIASGQRAPEPTLRLQPPHADTSWSSPANPLVRPDGQTSTVALAALGVLGAAGGTVAVGLGAGRLTNDLVIGVGGAFLGQGLAVPLLVHLGNDRRGLLWPALLTGVGISAAAFGTALAANSLTPLYVAPLIHVPVSIMIERHTSHRATWWSSASRPANEGPPVSPR